VKTIRNNSVVALFIVALLYILANIAYFATGNHCRRTFILQHLTELIVPAKQLIDAQEIAASLFFDHVFGHNGYDRGFNFLIALSALGNLISTLLGTSRMIRECGR
jgi:hypothetical protein